MGANTQTAARNACVFAGQSDKSCASGDLAENDHARLRTSADYSARFGAHWAVLAPTGPFRADSGMFGGTGLQILHVHLDGPVRRE